MALDVQVGHFQGIEGEVAQHHFGAGEDVSTGDTDAARAGAEDEHPRRLLGQPGGELLLDQFGDGRTRHQHSLVDHEGHATEPGLAQQVGHRHALFDASAQQFAQVCALILFQAAVQVAVGNLVGQMQRAEHQLAGFVPGVIGAVPEEQVFGMETADCPANVVTQGAQAGFGHGSYLRKRAADSTTPAAREQPTTADERPPRTPLQARGD
ncbi:hypothetical protein D9M72_371070 [compost metagenome]